MYDTREAPSSSSKQQFAPHSKQPVKDMPIPDDQSAPHSKQPVEDVPIPDDVNILDSEDIDTVHLPKIKTRPDWLKPVPEEDRPETLEPDWIIPLTDLREAENNWADALAKSYKDPEENKLLSKTGDMGSFIKWFCKRIRKKKLSKSDLEGPAFKVVKAFYENNISLQFQIEECHRLLTDQVDLVNPEGHRLVPDVSKPLPLGGLPGQGHRLVPDVSKPLPIGGPPGQADALAKSYKDLEENKLLSKTGDMGSADYNEYKISEADFKNLHLNDFEDLNIIIRQRMGDLQLGIESYQTKLNLTEPRWDALDFLYKEDYTIISKLRVVIYRYRNDQKKMLRENEVHKFSDGTLTRVLHKLDHMVKDYRLFQYNSGMKNRIWSKENKRRSEEFMEVIKRLN
nr:hypothetical protein [Tanacetum cinerariifolium]